MITNMARPPGPSIVWFAIGAGIDIAIIAATWGLGRHFGLWQFIRDLAHQRADVVSEPRQCDWSNCEADAEPYLRWCLYHYQIWQYLNTPAPPK